MLLAMFKSGHWGIRIIPMMPSKRGSLGQRWWLLIGDWGLLWDPHRQLLEKEPHYKRSSSTVRRNHLPRCRSCMGFFEFQECGKRISCHLSSLTALDQGNRDFCQPGDPKLNGRCSVRLCASLVSNPRKLGRRCWFWNILDIWLTHNIHPSSSLRGRHTKPTSGARAAGPQLQNAARRWLVRGASPRGWGNSATNWEAGILKSVSINLLIAWFALNNGRCNTWADESDESCPGWPPKSLWVPKVTMAAQWIGPWNGRRGIQTWVVICALIFFSKIESSHVLGCILPFCYMFVSVFEEWSARLMRFYLQLSNCVEVFKPAASCLNWQIWVQKKPIELQECRSPRCLTQVT